MWCIGYGVQGFLACYPHSPHGNSPRQIFLVRQGGTKKKPNDRIGRLG
jgi:hypothetical protein